MIQLVILILVNAAGACLAFFYFSQQARSRPQLVSVVNHLGALGLAWLTFTILFGLLQTFDLLEASGDRVLVEGFTTGLVVAMRLFLFGFVIICGPFTLYLRLSPQHPS